MGIVVSEHIFPFPEVDITAQLCCYLTEVDEYSLKLQNDSLSACV